MMLENANSLSSNISMLGVCVSSSAVVRVRCLFFSHGNPVPLIFNSLVWRFTHGRDKPSNSGEMSREPLLTWLYETGKKKNHHLVIPGFCIVYSTKPERRKAAFPQLSLNTEIISAKLSRQLWELRQSFPGSANLWHIDFHLKAVDWYCFGRTVVY